MQHKAVYLLFYKFTLHVSGVTAPIIMSTQNCNYSPRYWPCCAVQLPPSNVAKLPWQRWREVAAVPVPEAVVTVLSWSRWREVAAVPVPEAVVTVLCIPEDGCGWHPKHVEWTCTIINRLLCVASRWTVINIQGVPGTMCQTSGECSLC